jgi:chromosomal replication initiation ATPase DnaA
MKISESRLSPYVAPGIKLENDAVRIKKIVCEVAGISAADMDHNTRRMQIVHARQVFFYLMRQFSNKSTSEIGSLCAGRDHATVIHSTKILKNSIRLGFGPQYELFKKAVMVIKHS